MEPDQHPNTARLDQTKIVQTKNFDSGPSACAHSHYLEPVSIPGKMLPPHLYARSENRNGRPCERVMTFLSGPLELIAPVTGQAEVVQFGTSASGQWNNMINEHRYADDFGASAVAATMVRQIRHTPTDLLSDFRPRCAHEATSVAGDTVWPRHFNSARAYDRRNTNLSVAALNSSNSRRSLFVNASSSFFANNFR